jgi:HCOMODA/2-hydroxy-3-carboxy-muconic semialdehyde decarboxylase
MFRQVQLWYQSPAMDLEQLQVRVRVVARALGRSGLVSAWGHCSARLDAKRFLVSASRPMGLLKVGEGGTVVRVDAPLPTGVPGEVRIHQQIYRRRPEVGGVCRVYPPTVVALSSQRIVPHPRHGAGAYVAGTAFWDDTRLVHDDALAARLAEQLGEASTLVLRGGGAVTCATSLENALVLAYCLEDAARVEATVRGTLVDEEEELLRLSDEEVVARRVTTDGIFERLWELLTDGDPEAGSLRVADLFPPGR